MIKQRSLDLGKIGRALKSVAGTITLLSDEQGEVRLHIAEALLSRGEKNGPDPALRLIDTVQGAALRRLGHSDRKVVRRLPLCLKRRIFAISSA